MKKVIIVLTLFLTMVSHLSAKSSEAITREYFDLLQSKKWDEISLLYDKDALADFKEMLSFLTELPDEQSGAVLSQFFGSGVTKDSVAKMSDREFFAAFLSGVMGKLGDVKFTKIDVLGTISEGDDLEHVVTRTYVGMGEMSMEAMEVISYRKSGNNKAIILQGKVKGMAQQLRAAFGKQ